MYTLRIKFYPNVSVTTSWHNVLLSTGGGPSVVPGRILHGSRFTGGVWY